jgi:hypothetical protein
MAAQIMTLPRRVPVQVPSDRVAPSARRVRPSEPVVLFLAFAALYLGVAALLVSRNIIFADAMSRVGNAYYVLYSRDPHLPAVGFVWNPLPSLVLLPILPFKAVAPGLVALGFAGNIQSAVMMAATVVAMGSCLRKIGVPRLPRLVVLVLFGVQPMILLYAGSGLSEPMLMFFLTVTVSCLISWLQGRRSVGHLVGAGLALGFAYMTRYEAIAPALSVALLVAAVSYLRAHGSQRERLATVCNDVILVAGPFLFAFALWMAMGKILVDQWLPTFSSVYGNSAQVRSGSASIQSVTGNTALETSDYIGRQINGLAPLLLVLVVAAAVLAVRRRSLVVLAGPAVYGAVSAFSALVLLLHSSFGWLRFQIMVIPLAALLAGTVVVLAQKAAPRPEAGTLLGGSPWTALRLRAPVLATAVVSMCLAAALPVQLQTLTTTSTGLAREESPMLHSAISPEQATAEERRSLLIYRTEREIAGYIDRLNAGEGTVLADTAYAYSVVMASRDPKQFVVTSDLDFAGAVTDPRGHGVRYLLVPAPELGHSDALQGQWPGLYADGAGIATLEQTFDGAFFGDWRLYRVN